MAGSGVFPKTGSGSGGTDLIYKNDYNTIQSAVAAVKTTYYGVACDSSQLGSSTTIIPNITEWNNLRTDINSCYKHITGSDSAIGSKTTGQLITASNSNAYKTAAEYIETNKNTVYASTQLANFANSDSSTRNGGTNPWNSNITYQVRTTFSSSANASYFFQAGGYFTIQLTSNTGSGGTKNTNWASVINSVSNWTYTLADYTAGNKSNTYNVTSYSSSALTVSCVKESATSLLFTCYFNDATAGNVDELIDNYITATWGYYRSTDAIVTAYPATINKTIDLTSGGLAPVATYSFGTIPTSIDEGSAGTINVNTTNVADSTTLYWTMSAPGDFSTSSGSFVVNSNVGSFTVTPAADSTTEGAETFTVSIRTGSTGGTIVATSNSITINDTSIGAASYSFGTIPTSINEGASGTFNVSTANVSDGTTLYWTIASNAGDFGTTSGSFVVNSNAGSFSVSPTADSTTEGSETFTVAIRTGSISGSVVATSGSVTINDTSVLSATAAITTDYIESNYVAGLGATTMQAWSQLAFLTTGTSRVTIGDNSAPETRSILSGEWLTTSPTAVSTTTAGLFDIELTPDAATLAIDGTTFTPGLQVTRTVTSTGTSWNTRIQLGTTEVFRYLFVEVTDSLGGTVNENATAYFTATIYLHGTNTVQTSTAITMVSSAGSIGA